MADSFGAKRVLRVGEKSYTIYSLKALAGVADLATVPYSLKILLENLLRKEDGVSVTKSDIESLASSNTSWDAKEIAFSPARILMQDFTGVPAVVDLGAMRDAMADLGGDPTKVNPLIPAELVIDHSVIADDFGHRESFSINASLEASRNKERYQFLRWGQQAFDNFVVVPPDTGICHQVNLEYLARVVFVDSEGNAYPDTLVGTDSHTPMVNGLGVVGWGVGGIEAEAAMLGQPISMLVPKVVGIKLTGSLPVGTTATDMVLTVTELLRKHGVVGKFVEFYGPGCANVSLENRATIGNMSPEYGSTITIFPIDDETLRFMRLTGRSEGQIALVEAYAKEQGLWLDPNAEPVYNESIELDLSTVEPSLAGPARPQDRVPLREAKARFASALAKLAEQGSIGSTESKPTPVTLADGRSFTVDNGSVVIAAITSCTNTSNPSVMIAAGLLARKAVERGLTAKPWVKTTLAPGSKVVMDYYDRAGLTPYLEKLGFFLVGYGCTTCIGNSGPLLPEISEAVNSANLATVSVLSGNRNFEGRINPDVRMNYLASPPLVIAYAIAGSMDFDLNGEPLGTDQDGKPVYLADIWPSAEEVTEVLRGSIDTEMFAQSYATAFEGDERWKALEVPSGSSFAWDNEHSTYVHKPPFFEGMTREPAPIAPVRNARVLAVLGDSVTTDHISPAGNIRATSPAGQWLIERGVEVSDFNSYGARRGNHEVMIRGTFANIRIRNRLADGKEGGYTKLLPDGNVTTIYEAAMAYKERGVPLVILAGKEYGSGSSRDWAAKGTYLLGVRAVIAESFERIHRSNLVGMGILPLQFPAGESIDSLGLTGYETITIKGLESLAQGTRAPETLTVEADGKIFEAKVRIDTPKELDYYRNGGILQYVIRNLARD
ncbi:MAG: aconitate hydratase AcnA [Actinomycetota bacterium]|nr:aconitate hydratase AcnA [Actinomycetota bacterium]